MTDYVIIHRLDEIDARLAEIGEHIFNMEVDSKKEPELDFKPGPLFHSWPEDVDHSMWVRLDRRSNRGRRDTDEYCPSTFESIHGDRRRQYDRRCCS